MQAISFTFFTHWPFLKPFQIKIINFPKWHTGGWSARNPVTCLYLFCALPDPRLTPTILGLYRKLRRSVKSQKAAVDRLTGREFVRSKLLASKSLRSWSQSKTRTGRKYPGQPIHHSPVWSEDPRHDLKRALRYNSK